MTGTTAGTRFGRGPWLARALVYTLMVVEALFLLTTLPSLIALLLDRDAANVPLAAACLLPVGPALSAALHALHHRRLDLADLHPMAMFWRGYRLNVRGASEVVGAVARMDDRHRDRPRESSARLGVPSWWAVLSVVIVLASALRVANTLVIVSLFEVPHPDVARLAAYFLTGSFRVTLSNPQPSRRRGMRHADRLRGAAGDAGLSAGFGAPAEQPLLITEVRRRFTA